MNENPEIFKALSDEVRIRIINLFIKSGRNICVCELMDALKLPQYSVSKALLVLKASGLVKYEKKGLWVYYNLNSESPDNAKMFDFLNQFLNSDIFREDLERLNDRFLLREDGNCVVGILPEEELYKIITAKKEQVRIDASDC